MITHFNWTNECEATLNISGDHPFFAGHFPQNPILPAVAVIEITREPGVQSSGQHFGGRVNRAAVHHQREIYPADWAECVPYLTYPDGGGISPKLSRPLDGQHLGSGSCGAGYFID
jgi:hypothetical protein